MNYNLRHTFVAYVVVQGIGEGVSKPKNLGHRRKRASIQALWARQSSDDHSEIIDVKKRSNKNEKTLKTLKT